MFTPDLSTLISTNKSLAKSLAKLCKYIYAQGEIFYLPMYYNLKKFLNHLVVSILIALFFVSPTAALAANYGDGSYGGGTYGNGSTSISTTISSTVSSVTNTIGAFFCTSQAPASAPNLYEIDVKGDTAKLYFAPATGPYDKHFVSFGQGNNSEGNGAEFSTTNVKGALTYQVNKLAPNTYYTFKVRGGNGCKPGNWGSNLTIKTSGKNVKTIAKYYPKKQAKYVAAPAKKTQTKKYIWF
jgi:hypothetical protein